MTPMRKNWLLPAALAAVALAGCTRGGNLQTEEAVKQAIDKYLASRPNVNMGSMSATVTGVRFQGEEAEAAVRFQAKNDAKASMSMRYKLRRDGRQFVVVAPGGHIGLDSQLGDHVIAYALP